MTVERKKKRARRALALVAVETAQTELGGTYRELGEATGRPLRSLRRWRGRQGRGAPLLSYPGPGKVALLELETLLSDLLALVHSRRRTAGTGALYAQFRDQVSRRVLAEVVAGLRQEYFHRQAALKRRINWNTPGLIWSMDDMEMTWLELGLAGFEPPKVSWHQVRDLSSRYHFPPLVTTALAPGAAVAERLEALFLENGPPLFLKRDNGGNLNQAAVNAVLAKYLVIPLNSPPHYPPYNGGIEQAQDEFQEALLAKFLGRTWPGAGADEMLSVLQMASEVVSHDLNRRRRPCLRGHRAALNFEVGKQDRRFYYDRRQRREVFDEIKAMAAMSLAEIKLTDRRAADAAWRLAVETWLRREGHIAVSVGGKVLPYYACSERP
jgi:hypothetical protein